MMDNPELVASFCGEDTVEEEPAGGDDRSSVDQFAGERAQVLLCSGLPVHPVVEGLEHGGDFLGGQGDGVEVEVVLQSQGSAARGRRDQVAGRLGQGDTQAPA